MKYFFLSKVFAGVAVSAGIVLLSLSGVAHAASTDVGGRPAKPDRENPRSNDIFIHTLDKGESAKDAVLMINNTDEEKVLRIYAVDGVASNTGALTCKQQSEEKIAAGLWLDVAEDEVTLAPRAKKEVDFTVSVPKNADVGEHNACLVYQVKKDASEDESRGNVEIQTRSATRVAITVPGDLKKELIIENFDITPENNGHIYGVDVKNSGNVSADAVVAVSLKGVFGDTSFSDSGQFPMLPGETQNVLYRSDKLPFFGGFYMAEIKVIYDTRPGVFGVNTEDQSHLVTLTEQKRIFIMPNPILLGIAVVLLFVGLLWALWLMIARKKVNEDWEEYTVKKGDTIQSIAQSREASWKKIARENGLKAPYILTTDAKMLVPKILPKDKE